MSKRRKIALAVVCLAALIVALTLSRRVHDPVHNGRRASEWFTLALTPGTNSPAAQQAIRAMGTNALPMLIHKLERRETRVHRLYQSAWVKAPAGLKKMIPRPSTIGLEQQQALLLLRFSGAEARAAVPTVLDLLEDLPRPTKPAVPPGGPPVVVATTDPYSLRQLALELLIPMGGEDPRLITAILNEAEDGRLNSVIRMSFRDSGLSKLRSAALQSTSKLLEAAGSTNVGHRAVAARLLGFMAEDSREAVEALIRILRQDDGLASPVAAESLSRANPGHPGLVSALVEGLGTKDQRFRYSPAASLLNQYSQGVYCLSAANALRQMAPRSKEVIPELVQALSSDNLRARVGAAATLEWIGPPAQQAVPALRTLADAEELEVRYQALRALHAIAGDREAWLALKGMEMRDGNESDRCQAIKEVQNTGKGHPVAVQFLVNALATDESFRVRGFAARALGELGAQEAIPALRKALDDEWFNVRDEAAAALKKLGPEQ